MLKQLIKLMDDPKENIKYNPNFKLIIVKWKIILENKLSLYLQSKGKAKNKIYKETLNLFLFMYILLYNLKTAEKIIVFFKINSYTIIQMIKRAIIVFQEDDEKLDLDNIKISNFIMNICFDDIKEKIYSYNNEELIQIYQKEIYCELLLLFPSTNERFNEDKKYDIFINNIMELKLDKYIKNLKRENSNNFCRNLIPILLTNPGFNFISFYTHIINKHIEIIRKDYNNELTSLFRADDFTNDLIKNLIIIFGNDSFIKSFYFSLPKEYLSNNEITFDLDTFENFLHKFIENLAKTLPFIIRVLLKITYNCVKDLNKKEESFNVVYTVLIFNFFISPTTYDIFDISMAKHKSLRQLTRILRNIFFGKEFDSNDKLSYFNKKVKIFHDYINDQFNLLIEGIDIEKDKDDINQKINNILSNAKKTNDKIIANENIVLPWFCYLYFWKNILDCIKDIPDIE